MNLNYILKKKHIFKKRRLFFYKRKYKFSMGTSALVNLKPQRFELIYMRGFKKVIRRRHIRAKMRFKKRKFWFFVRPNCILSGKSTNSRMGAGVGTLIRIATNLRPYRNLVEFRNYSPRWIQKVHRQLRFRYPIKFLAIYNS